MTDDDVLQDGGMWESLLPEYGESFKDNRAKVSADTFNKSKIFAHSKGRQ